jgi:hypothetical protein
MTTADGFCPQEEYHDIQNETSRSQFTELPVDSFSSLPN